MLEKLNFAGSRGVVGGAEGFCDRRPGVGDAIPQADEAFSVNTDASPSLEVSKMFSGLHFSFCDPLYL